MLGCYIISTILWRNSIWKLSFNTTNRYINIIVFEKCVFVINRKFERSVSENCSVSVGAWKKSILRRYLYYCCTQSSNKLFSLFVIPGLSFKKLYGSCRESFLVSSDLSLRAQLTEFVDHKMVKFRRSVDGTECLIIPMPNQLLRQFLNEHSNWIWLCKLATLMNDASLNFHRHLII